MSEYVKNYTDEIKKIIKNTRLNAEQKKVLDDCLNNRIRKYNNPLRDVFKDIYKMYVANVSVTDIAAAYDKNPRTIQIMLKKLELNRDLKTAQSIAVKKRDYVEIRKTYKKTMHKRLVSNQLTGSAIENIIRHDINIKLVDMFPNDLVVVGVNTMTKVGELDIPIVIQKDNVLYKFGVEVDDRLFHKDLKVKTRDAAKQGELEKIGYKMFRMETNAYLRGIGKGQDHYIKYANEIEPKIIDICNEIKNIVK